VAEFKVGILDSGLDLTHPCFQGLKLSEFVTVDKDTGTITECPPNDSQWHGTFCAAILAGHIANNFLRGVAPAIELFAAQVFDAKWGSSTASVHNALEWCIQKNVKIVSFSLGIPNQDDVWSAVVEEYLATGGVLVAGIGNDYGGDAPTISPGNYPLDGIVSVGAHDSTGNVWPQSGGGTVSWNPGSFGGSVISEVNPELVAPGVSITSVGKAGAMEIGDGTSFATPHVAGLLAAIWGCNPGWSRDQVIQKLFSHLVGSGESGKSDRYGFGKIDADALYSDLIA
jgi:subtilisin family serine protease